MAESTLVARNRRRGQPLSCAECRRLKLRCSRQFPCTSCVKKGCAAICPDGSLTTGRGNRFVLKNTEELHEKINILANRVRQLEDALRDTYSQLTSETHPLLTDDLLDIKRPLERDTQDEAPQEPDVDTAEAIDAVGSLSITDSGHTKFFGPAANAWYLLQNEEGAEDAVESPQGPLPADIPWLSYTYPFSTAVPESASAVRTSLIQCLPDHQEARRLGNIYFRNAAWMYTPLPEAEFYSTILPRFYEQLSPVEHDAHDSHRLAMLFLVLAMGVLLDLDEQPNSPNATRYYQLGKAALSLDSILEHQTIPAIQALILMCHYMFLSHIDGPRWALMGLAVKLALTLGLHRDGNKWNLNPEEAFRRRTLFYELLTYDSWQSLTFGRPPSLSMAFIDCQIPEVPTAKTDQGEPEMSFTAWKHRFVSRCQSVVHEQAFGARISSYRTIIDLDKKVRDFYMPPSLRVPGFGGARIEAEQSPASFEQILQGYCAVSIREITIFYMHRGFFASALQDHPDDPLGSKYAQSVLKAYESACSYVALVRSLYSQYPAITGRMWFFFTHVFSCSIVLGAILAKSPSLPFAPSALSHLDSACALFERFSDSPRAIKVLPVLRKLKSRAVASMNDYRSRSSVSRSVQQGTSLKEDDELDILGGKTRLISRKSPSLPSSPNGSSSQVGSSPREPVDHSPTQSMAPRIPEPSPPTAQAYVDIPPPPQQWYGPSHDGYGYPQYQSYQEAPHHQSGYWHQHMVPHDVGPSSMAPQTMGLDVTIQNAAYADLDPMAGQYMTQYMSGGGSPEGSMHHDASWQALWTQLNQS